MRTSNRFLASAIGLSLAFGLTACGGMPTNRTVYSVHQPVVERSSMALDVTTSPDGLPLYEQRRVASWFETMDLDYGDRVSVDDPSGNEDARAAVALLAGRYGIMLADGSPIPSAEIAPGQARIIITRSRASVPGCPDWSASSDSTLGNGLSANYGCATNSNLAAMVANPEDLIKGQKGSPDTYIDTSKTTIDTYGESVGKAVGQVSGGVGGGN
ncbi:CpaD family pilus assembly protein [Qipengyuania sp.]|uniref:CpaD family pilus assembly protein n=1 Tax=Qipengyuania sp. TaxID=2004515 RepID=UPI0035C7DD42